MDKSNIKGIATERGGKTGHLAILARHFEIPAVVGIKGLTSEVQENEFILLDGDAGIVYKNPHISRIKNYGISEAFPKENPMERKSLNCYTRDRERVHIKVNLEAGENCQNIHQVGAEGVGLYRTESLLMENSIKFSNEEEQFFSL